MEFKKLMEGEILQRRELRNILKGILEGEFTEIQTGAILTALSVRGEEVHEIEEGVRYLLELAEEAPCGRGAIDIVGTGGDGLNTINISTASSFVAAAAGARVLKHGNRSVSSTSGSSDLLEALGIPVTALKEKNKRIYEESGMAFLYAPQYHPALKSVGPVRKDLGVRSIFNIMGPLANPSTPDFFLLGTYSEDLQEKMAAILRGLGVKRAMVVHGVEDGCDEISICGATKVIEIDGQSLRRYNIHPEELGLTKRSVDDIRGGTPGENARFIGDVLEGRDSGARKDAIVINTAGALYISGVADTLLEGVALARDTIESGRAFEKLEEYRRAAG